MLPSAEAEHLVALARDIATSELKPIAGEYEAESRFPREKFRLLGKSGLLGLPYPERWGGGDVSYEVYLQVLEELAAAWMTVGVGLSVHTMSCYPLARFGSDAQRDEWLPAMLGGDLLGAYALSEPQAGSDAAALSARAVRDGDDYLVSGTKAWITHAGQADFYTAMVRTSDDGGRGVSCLLIDAGTPGLSVAPLEHKMGLTGSPTAQLILRPGPGPGGAPPRGRRPGSEDRAGGAGLRAARHRRVRGRAGPGGAGRGRVLRGPAFPVRPADHRVPGPGVPAGRHGGGRGVGARHLPGGGPAPGPRACRSTGRRRSRSWWPPTWRCA